MKKIIFILVISILLMSQSSAVKTEPVTEEIIAAFESDLAVFFESSETGDWDTYLDLTYPGLFEIAPKEALVAQFEQIEAMGISLTIGNMEIQDTSDMAAYGNEWFVKIDYSADMEIKLSKELESMYELFCSQFEQQYSGGEIEKTPPNKLLIKNADASMLAVSSDRKIWKYLEISEEGEQIMSVIIPEPVYDYFFE
jgi:hypothetical protein